MVTAQPSVSFSRQRLIGVHTAIAGGLHNSITEARTKNCNTWQIFSRNPRGWTARPLGSEEIEHFHRVRSTADIGPCVIHACYLINLASSVPELRQKSIAAFHDEIERALVLGADYLVLHPGSAGTAGPDQAIAGCAAAIREAANGLIRKMTGSRLEILIENTAGQGNQIGKSFEQVALLIKSLDGIPVGMCLDTAHSFAAGYDWRKPKAASAAFNLLDETVGFERVKVVHFNDSKAVFGSQVDRHWHIGQGEIGPTGLARVLNHPRLKVVPFILETPKEGDADVINLAATRALCR